MGVVVREGLVYVFVLVAFGECWVEWEFWLFEEGLFFFRLVFFRGVV